jgi:flagellar FliL protein
MATAAKPPAKQESASAPESSPPPRRGGKLLLIVVLTLLLLLILVAAGIVVLLLAKKGSSHGDEARVEASMSVPASPSTAVDLSKPPIFAPLDPFTVNLRAEHGEDDRYLQAVIALRVPDQKTADAMKGFMPEIRHRINMLLSSKLPSEVQDIKGREMLANEIQTQLNTLLGFPPPPPEPPDSQFRPSSQGPIQAVLFNSFIIQ